MRKRLTVSALVIVGLCSLPRPAVAQLNGFNIKGDQGVKSGSQAPPGIYYGAPFYWYGTDTVKDEDGRAFSTTGELNMFLGGPLVNVVTTKTVLGGNYGFMAVFPFANVRAELPRLDNNPAPGISDMYVQPFNLGWAHQSRRRARRIRFLCPDWPLCRGSERQHGSGNVGPRGVRRFDGVLRREEGVACRHDRRD